MEQALRSLERMPHRNRIYPVAHPTEHEVRYTCVGNYLLLYWADEEASQVMVARFVYGGRQVERLVK